MAPRHRPLKLADALSGARRPRLRRGRVAALRLGGGLRRLLAVSSPATASWSPTAYIFPPGDSCDGVLARYGITTSYYDPLIGAGIAALIKSDTRAVFVESPGSLSFEMQDVPAIAAAAHHKGAVVLMDNTWASPLYFHAFDKGVDLSIQSGTKYIGGHSDVMLGTVAANKATWPRLSETVYAMGLCVGPDDMYLGLRGLRTMGVRLAQHYASGVKVARWLAGRPALARVLHPKKGSGPYHLAAIFRRLRLVQHRAPAGSAGGGACLPRRAHLVRHRRLLGRVREPRHSVRLHRHAVGDPVGPGRTHRAVPYRAGGCRGSDRRSRTRLCGPGRGAPGPERVNDFALERTFVQIGTTMARLRAAARPRYRHHESVKGVTEMLLPPNETLSDAIA